MRLSEQLTRLENDLTRTLSELAVLKEDILCLEQENERLRQKIKENTETNSRPAYDGEGHEALLSLYNEGYHVCHSFYGQERDNKDCVFCLGVLNNGE